MGAEQSTESQHPNESGKPLPTEPPPPEMVPISKLQIPIRSGSIGHITSTAAIDAHRPTDMIATAPDASARAEAARSTSFLHRLPALALPLTGKEHSVLTSTMGAEQSTESRHPKESVQPLPPEPAPPVMVPTSNLQIPIGRITSAVAIDAQRPTATTDPAQDAALAEPSPPQDSIRKLTYGQLLVRALTMKGQLAMQREDERQAHVEVERLGASA